MRTTTAPHAGAPDTVAELIARQWGDHRPGLKHGADGPTGATVLSRHRTAAASAARAALLADLLPPGAEPHVGVLLDNTPEFPFWLGAAAL
ncbi:acyl-CoA synthetase, partial [Streptomyces sp. NPDC048551]